MTLDAAAEQITAALSDEPSIDPRYGELQARIRNHLEVKGDGGKQWCGTENLVRLLLCIECKYTEHCTRCNDRCGAFPEFIGYWSTVRGELYDFLIRYGIDPPTLRTPADAISTATSLFPTYEEYESHCRTIIPVMLRRYGYVDFDGNLERAVGLI